MRDFGVSSIGFCAARGSPRRRGRHQAGSTHGSCGAGQGFLLAGRSHGQGFGFPRAAWTGSSGMGPPMGGGQHPKEGPKCPAGVGIGIWDLGGRCQQPPHPSSTLPTAPRGLWRRWGPRGGPQPHFPPRQLPQTLLAPVFPLQTCQRGPLNPILSKSGKKLIIWGVSDPLHPPRGLLGPPGKWGGGRRCMGFMGFVGSVPQWGMNGARPAPPLSPFSFFFYFFFLFFFFWPGPREPKHYHKCSKPLGPVTWGTAHTPLGGCGLPFGARDPQKPTGLGADRPPWGRTDGRGAATPASSRALGCGCLWGCGIPFLQSPRAAGWGLPGSLSPPGLGDTAGAQPRGWR